MGKRVRVDGYACGGVLQFFGNHKVKNIPRCGVELDQPVGKNNGTVGGHVYFKCADNHGVLVGPRKVKLEDAAAPVRDSTCLCLCVRACVCLCLFVRACVCVCVRGRVCVCLCAELTTLCCLDPLFAALQVADDVYENNDADGFADAAPTGECHSIATQ